MPPWPASTPGPGLTPSDDRGGDLRPADMRNYPASAGRTPDTASGATAEARCHGNYIDVAPQQAPSQSSPLVGYRHEYQSAESSPGRFTYNPQDFAQFQLSYERPSYPASPTGQSRPYPSYNPATHGASTVTNATVVQRPSIRQYIVHRGSPEAAPVPALISSSPSGPPYTAVPAASEPSIDPHSYPMQISHVDARTYGSTAHPLPLPPGPDGSSHRSSFYSPPAPPPPPTFPALPSSVRADDELMVPAAILPGQLLMMPDLPNSPYPSSDWQYRHLPCPPDYGRRDALGVAYGSHATLPSQPPAHPLPSPPAPSPPQHRSWRQDHRPKYPHSRPLPGPPDQPTVNGLHDHTMDEHGRESPTEEQLAQDSIWREVEAAVMNSDPRSRMSPHSPATSADEPSPPSEALDRTDPLVARTSLSRPNSRDSRRSNGHLPTPGTGRSDDYDDPYDDASDAEAEAGLVAMRLADEQDAASSLRSESGHLVSPRSPRSGRSLPEDDAVDGSSDSDVATFDVGLAAGGYEGHMSYGEEAISGSGHQRRSFGDYRAMPTSPNHGQTNVDRNARYSMSLHRAAPSASSVGLTRPGETFYERKQSYEGGDDASCDTNGRPETSRQSLIGDEIPEIFYHPGLQMSHSNRPLPPTPASARNGVPRIAAPVTGSPISRGPYTERESSYGSTNDMPDSQLMSPTGLAVPRSSSLSSHSNTPQAVPPVRSKTDAEERRARLLKQQQLGIYPVAVDQDATFSAGTSQSAMTLDLPAIPSGRRFNPSKLSTADFRRCTEPWALSAITEWVKDLSDDTTDLKRSTVVNAIVALFTHKMPTMNTADAETLSARVVQEMFSAGALVHDEEWVKLGSETLTGVLWQLTGSGCYAPRLHGQAMAGRCYSHHCSRTLKKINLQTQAQEPRRKLEDWATFHKVQKEEIEQSNTKEVKRQMNLHEIVQTEDQYMDQLNVLLNLYRDQLRSMQPPIIQPSRVERFANDCFGRVEPIRKVNEDFLLAQLKYRQQEQGPWVVGFSDIFREWIRKARTAYIEYAASFPNASLTVRKEAERNILFRQFLDQVRENERSKRLGWDTYLKAPITRLQRYSLLLSTVLGNTTQDTEEKANLQVAIDEIKAVTLDCDARVAETSKKVDLVELGSKLVLRPGMQNVELNLNHLGRELIFEGDLQRTGANRFTWLETHAILFDHYLVLAKTIHPKATTTGPKYEAYDVSKLVGCPERVRLRREVLTTSKPIPMDLLALEGTLDDAVPKSSVKKIGAVTTVAARAQSANDTRHQRSTSNQDPGPGTLTQAKMNVSMSTIATTSSGKNSVASAGPDPPRDEKLLYPFRVKHLGQDVYTLYALNFQSRQDWCEKILEAKRKHAASLFVQNAEPFRLRVIADTAFAYDSLSGGPKDTIVSGTPLDRAIREAEKAFPATEPRPGPVCRAAVNCATEFVPLYGKAMIAIGTDYGVYVSEAETPRNWTKVRLISSRFRRC